MDDADATKGLVTADAAEVYEELFVPALFDQWPPRLLATAGVRAGERVLDVGCGTGVLARAALERVGPDGAVTGLDVNEAMLAVARRVEPRVDWQRGAAEQLPFADGRFDHALCQMALMFVDDRRAAVSEMARVVGPGGTVTIATWASVERSPGYDAVVQLLDDVIGPFAADALRAPFCLGDVEVLRGILAGVAPDPVVVRVDGTARFPSVASWMRTDICGWTLAGLVDDRQFDALVRAAEQHLDRFAGPDGRVAFAAPAIVAHATVGP